MGRPKKSVSAKKEVDSSATVVNNLKKENEELKNQLKLLNETLSDKLKQLIEENKELREKLEKKKSTDTYVGIRSVSNGNVWLPAPESRTGDPTTKNMGRMLKPGKATIVPSYWVVDWITSNYLGLKMGDVVIDNEAAKKISPNVEFVDIEIPEDFYLFDYNAEQIRNMATNNVKTLMSYINKNKKNRNVLNQVRGILTAELDKYDEDSTEYIDINNLLERINSFIAKEDVK